MTEQPVLLLAAKVFQLSMLAVGGYITILPDLSRYVVLTMEWMTAERFALLFALALAAPGPNVLIVTLLGWTLGGALGAVLATLAAILPTFALSLLMGLFWGRFRGSGAQILLTRSLTPIAVGMLFTTALMLVEITWGGEWRKLLAALAVALLSVTTRCNPLLPMGLAALAGAFGLL